MPAALDQLQVLEVGSGVAAAYGAKLLADLGAQVIKVEPPGGGDATRARGPFPGDVPHPEKSGLFLYLNANKRGITLDLTRPRGREVLERLAARADLLVHDVHPSEMAGRGLDYERLAAACPGLVMTSIAPFGLSGPHAGYRGPDVVTWSAGGIAALNGEPARPDLPPLKAFGDQSGFQAGLNAAIGSLGAPLARPATGRGEHVEGSTQEGLAAIPQLTLEVWPYCGLLAPPRPARPGLDHGRPARLAAPEGTRLLRHHRASRGRPAHRAGRALPALHHAVDVARARALPRPAHRRRAGRDRPRRDRAGARGGRVDGRPRAARRHPGGRLHLGVGRAVLHPPARAPRRRGHPRRDRDPRVRDASAAAVRRLRARPEPQRLLQPVQPGEEERRARFEAGRG